VEMHGGSITAESAGPSKGSAFRLRLPVMEFAPASSDVTEPDSRLPPQNAALKVLIVDDNVDVAQTMGWMLETIGHDYRMVHEGKLAVPTAQDYRPDAILLDIGMPGMDGYAVCRALREQTLFDDTVIIAQTGWGQTQARAAPGESGFNHHLVKPVTMDRLEELLADIASARGKSHFAN
jgi:CheY-like chemotaxis protein